MFSNQPHHPVPEHLPQRNPHLLSSLPTLLSPHSTLCLRALACSDCFTCRDSCTAAASLSAPFTQRNIARHSHVAAGTGTAFLSVAE